MNNNLASISSAKHVRPFSFKRKEILVNPQIQAMSVFFYQKGCYGDLVTFHKLIGITEGVA